jgi:mono/diheme cytochrome c family protein
MDKKSRGRVPFVPIVGMSMVVLLIACGGGSGAAGGKAAAGEKLYNSNCALCHGQGGVGKPALGTDLRGNDFLAGLSDDEVVQFLEEGRRADHPLNDKGVDMPPKGGNPGLTDQDLRAIVAYLRSLS